jgi:Response regulator containing a CheY-like receiver domain and an HD-GYP domain
MSSDALPSRSALVAVIDGNGQHRAQVCGALLSFYRAIEFSDCSSAWDALSIEPPYVIIVDEKAPSIGGFEFLRKLRADPVLRSVPLVCMTNGPREYLPPDMQDGSISAFLPKPFRRSALLRTISSLVNNTVESRWNDLPDLQRNALQRTLKLFDGVSDLISTGATLDYSTVTEACTPLVEAVSNEDFGTIMAGVRDHDNYSYAHSLRSATLLSLFGNTLGLSAAERTILACGGLMHDVGKMKIPHEVLNKAGKLTPDEWVVMRSHVPHTLDYLTNCPTMPKGVMIIAAQHHEKLDGTGYPNGLKGGQLNSLARMAAIVDVYGALTDRRVYKPPMPPEEALKIMTGQMGNHLDQGLVGTFRDVFLDVMRSQKLEGGDDTDDRTAFPDSFVA